MSDSPHDHEREALAWLKQRLPDRPAYHVWANFEFTTHNGQIYEVDALAITDNGVHLLEIKGYPGRIDGDANNWQWTRPDGRFRQFDNPRLLANRKAKALKSLLLNTKAFRKHRHEFPFVAESVFLSDPKLVSGLNPQGRFGVFGRDGATKDEPLPPERAALGGIVDHLMSLEPDDNGRPRRRLDPRVVERVVKAMDEIGIRERSSRREVGDFRVGRLLHDVDADVTTGVAYQDFEATHRSLDLQRRLRIYPLELNATADQREAASRAARREFELLHRLDHPGIIKPVSFTEHERGPVLVFEYDPDEVSLATYLNDPANENLSVDERLEIVRQVAEALAYANDHGVFHRSLSPAAVLVCPRADGPPRVRVSNWHTGARVAEGSTGTVATGTRHTHIEALATSDAELYRAPEFGQPEARPALLDVFSLGALALFILTGEEPASSARQLRQSLSAVGYLDPSALTDTIDDDLAGLVQIATSKLPSQRPGNAAEFIGYLDAVEEQWNLDERDAEVEELSPRDARRGDTLYDGRFEVVQRLGRGSTAVALLVIDTERAAQLCVLKFAEDPENNERILDEAAALDGLQHESIAMLLDGPFEIASHAAIVITYAGPKIDRPQGAPATPTEEEVASERGRTLASRLAAGPVGAELAQRWGEDLLSALRYLEGVGRAHRDIKPENLGVAPRGDRAELHLVLFDFSLSSVPLDRIEAGTQGYIDPFIDTDPKRRRLDPAADRYAATVTLFQLTTGDKPRYGDGTADPAMSGEPPRVEAAMFDAAAATGLVEFFTKALQPNADDRFGSADEMFWAWHAAFDAAARPATESNHPDGDDEFDIPEATTLDTPLAGLPLTRRAVSALERVDVTTVRQLLLYPLMKLRSIPGVGAKTRGEVREAADLLQARFADDLRAEAEQPPVPDTESAPAEEPLGESWLEQTAALAAPAARTKDLRTRAELARILAGLVPGRDPWASQADVAEWLGVTRARVSQLIGHLVKAWSKQPALTRVREQIRADLDALQVASAAQIATRLVRSAPDGLEPDRAQELALGLVRIATLIEGSIASPGWIMRRRQGASLLAVQPDAESGPATAQALADYAAALAAEAATLVDSHAILARGELLDRLHDVRRPAEVAPLPDAHLADLATDLCDNAAVNARLELYRVGLEPLPALAAVRRSFLSADRFTPEQVASKVEARFPAAAPLPGRPALDELLTEAGVDLVWRDDAYINPQHEAPPSTSYSSSVTHYPTGVGQPFPQEVADAAADFERRLNDARTAHGLLVLITDPKELEKAANQLRRLADTTFDLDALVTAKLDAIAAAGKPSWETLAKYDAAGPAGGAKWESQKSVLEGVLGEVGDEIAATSGAVLVTNLGLLARYNRLDLVVKWREALHAGAGDLSAVWLLVPASAGTEMPMVDGQPVEVISRNEWSRIPTEWLRNAHRAGAAS